VTAEAKPDPLIHPITRLSICGLLAAGADWIEFATLRDAAGISDSVLSKQSRVLEEAGYVKVRKGAVGRRPRTWFRLTAVGLTAVQGHLAWLAQLEEAVSARTPDIEATPLASGVLRAATQDSRGSRGDRGPQAAAQPPGPAASDRDRPRRVPPPVLGST